jgi:hypothetical protein
MSNRLVKQTDISTKRENTGADIARGIIEYILAIVGIALCVLVPLYLKNGYQNVGDAKYELYKWIMIIGGISLLLFTIVYWMLQSGVVEENKMTDTDWCVIAFLALAFLAALAGGNFSACMQGYNGWYMGMTALFSFALLYYFFSRFGKYYKVVLISLCATAMIAFTIGILHRLLIDPIGTYTGIDDKYKNQFLSTLGQATWYSSFVCTVLPLGIGAFWAGRKKWLRILSGIFSFAGFCTMVTQNSDSAYMALAGMLAVFFWFSVSTAVRMERFMEILLLFVGATRFMNLLFWIHPNPILSLDSISNFLVFHAAMWILFAAVVLLWLVSLILAKKDIYFVNIMKIVRNIIFACVAILILLAGVILTLSAKGALPENIAAVTDKIPYLTWSDSWGNGRGKTWAFSLQMFCDMDFLHKLLGVGPDGYAPYAYTLYQDRLVEMWGDRTLTNAHNEWMNAVINYGLLGATAYIGIFFTAMKNFAKKQMESPILTGYIACVVSYMCHNFFCYQQVCCTPFLFLIIGAGMYQLHKN